MHAGIIVRQFLIEVGKHDLNPIRAEFIAKFIAESTKIW